MAAGVAALTMILESNPYDELERKSKFIVNAVSAAAKEKGVENSNADGGVAILFLFQR